MFALAFLLAVALLLLTVEFFIIRDSADRVAAGTYPVPQRTLDYHATTAAQVYAVRMR